MATFSTNWEALSGNDLQVLLAARGLAAVGKNNLTNWDALSANDLSLLLAARGLTAKGGKDDFVKKLNDYTHWNRFTMKELKNELGKRGLPVSGKTKDELIQRLIEGRSEQAHHSMSVPQSYNPTSAPPVAHAQPFYQDLPATPPQSVPSHFASQPYYSNYTNAPPAHQIYQQPKLAAPPAVSVPVYSAPYNPPIAYAQPVYEEVANKTKKRQIKQCYVAYDDMTISELKCALTQRSLKVSGNKDELIDRLATFEDLNAMTFNEVLSGLLERGLSTSGGKRDLIDRFLAFEELNELTVCELKEKLSYRNLPCSGVKNDLVLRLLCHKEKGSQCMQTAEYVPQTFISYCQDKVPQAQKIKKRQTNQCCYIDCDEMTINELKVALAERSLKVSGDNQSSSQSFIIYSFTFKRQ